MPFTPSHAIVALPFIRTPLLPAAIAIGAMAPDLPLFVRFLPLSYQVTHTNVIASVVLALLLLVIWYALLRPAVRELSPTWLARRLPPGWDATGRRAWESVRAPRSGARPELGRRDLGHRTLWHRTWVFAALVALSLTLGVISHIVWDAFTHEGRWGLAVLPGLEEQWGPLLGYKWLQYGSGVLGLVVLAAFGAWWITRAGTGPFVRILPAWVRVGWWVSLPVILLVAWVGGLVVLGPIEGTFTAAHLSYRVLPPACAVWGALTLVLCAVVVGRRYSAGRRSSGGPGTPSVRQA